MSSSLILINRIAISRIIRTLRIVTCLLASLLLLAAASSVRADEAPQVTITLANGDRLSGRFVSVSAEWLRIETSYAGQISIRLREITAWQAANDKLRQQLAAFLPLKDKAHFVEARKAPSQPPPPHATKPDPWQRTINFAYTLTRGNDDVSDLSVAFSLSRKRGSRRLAFSSFGRYGVRNGAELAHLLSGTLRYERTLARQPVFTETSFEIDRMKRLDYRFTENVGLTYALLKGEGPRLSFDFGTGLTHEVYSNGLKRTTASSLVRATASQKINGRTQFQQQLTLFSDLLDLDAYRLHAEASVTMPLTPHIALRVAGLNRYDHRPKGLAKPNDFSLLTGLSFNF